MFASLVSFPGFYTKDELKSQKEAELIYAVHVTPITFPKKDNYCLNSAEEQISLEVNSINYAPLINLYTPKCNGNI